MDVVFETAEGRHFTMEIWFFSTVHQMKEKIHHYHGFPVDTQALYFNGKLLDDGKDTKFYDLLHGSRLHLSVDGGGGGGKQAPESSSTTSRQQMTSAAGKSFGADNSNNNNNNVNVGRFAVPAARTSRMVKVVVVLAEGKGRIGLEVNPCEKVRALRRELERAERRMQLSCVPSQDYFFIHKQNVMDDDRTFRCHDVRPGDTIDIFLGTVTSAP